VRRWERSLAQKGKSVTNLTGDGATGNRGTDGDRIANEASEIGNAHRRNRLVRVVLLVGYGGLLVLLLYSGVSALRTLQRLHTVEESAQGRPIARRRVLVTIVLSANHYSNQVEGLLLNLNSTDVANDEELSKGTKTAEAALQAYPPDRSPEEQTVIDELHRCLAEQNAVLRSLQEWSEGERQSRAQRAISEQILPLRRQFVAIEQKIESLNENETDAVHRSNLAQFDMLHDRLLRLVLIGVSSGLLIAIVTGLYILRLERQEELGYAELQRSRHQLQQLSARLQDAQEAERRSISRELHDEVGQALGLLLMDAGRLSSQLQADDEKGREAVQRIKTIAERTLQTVRNMALLLRPSMLDDLGLVPAVEWYAREMSQREGFEVEARSENVPEKLPDEVSLCIYRVVQEAVNNAQRHARATHVLVELSGMDGAIRVTIVDNGSGFDPQRSRGMGLVGMDERVKRLGGTLTIDSRSGAGATIRVQIALAGTNNQTNEENQSVAG
jgi:signal transduction histidine kinase